jgi:hypothetical protein
MNLKKIISRLFGVRIEDGIGLSTDNTVKLKQIPRRVSIGDPIGRNSALYEPNTESGYFELIGHKRMKNDVSAVVLRNTKTGDTFSIPYSLFTILFKKKTF